MKNYTVLKKVYWECENVTEYFESINNSEWVQKPNNYGDDLFNLNNANHTFIYMNATYEQFLNRCNGMIRG